MSEHRKTWSQMLGESLREAGVLVVVFYGVSVVIKVGGVALEEIASALVALSAGVALWLIGTMEELGE